ncbi:MAG: ribonuclease Z [candidate division Zixibacteria bacterium]|nr:ribonuclease Z [candidate division Zixibacteria bacterium]
MQPNKFTILGSSSGVPQAERNSAGYILNINERLNLIDCGGGVISSFLRRGFNPLDVDRVFISHTHPDHVCELPLFIQMISLAGRDERIDIFVPDEFVIPLRAYLNAVYIIPEKLPFELHIIGYNGGIVFDEDFKLTAIANSHLSQYSELIARLNLPNKMQSHSFQIEIGQKRLFYSGDIGGIDDIRDKLNGNDYVVMEMTHVDADVFFDFAPKTNVGEFVITHLGHSDEVSKLNLMARKAGMHNFSTAVDGIELVL